MGKLRKAVEKALNIRAHSRDGILQFLVPRYSRGDTTFLLDGREHLRRVRVSNPEVSAYHTLLYQGGVS